MSRDYKTRKPSKSTPEKGGSAFLGGFVGYALGLASAIGIWLYFNYAPSPFLPTEKVASSVEKSEAKAIPEQPKTPVKPQEEPVVTAEEKPRFDFYKILPGIEEPEINHEYKPAVAQPAQPQVTAKIPENSNKPAENVQQPIPPSRPNINPAVIAPQIAAVPPRTIPAEPIQQPVAPQVKIPPPVKEKFFLQAGSFRKNDEAENMKARLAFLGVSASIQPIDLAEKGTWYRVRIGPLTNKADIDEISASLKENGIGAQFIKVQ
ncbi:SPOR domain-containing protein [Nitrosomonas sp.]|uniref:SPOR domain-containing protein n=1 Tax=Nitrosomonas sp. TaxID=42353 RepID=UPI0025E7B024|nr:SPOR domain-containing protein [Nitrosomonas sp.]